MPKAGNVTVYDTSLGWRYPNPKMKKMFPLEAMGCTAENIVDRMNISREVQDIFAYNSHQKALQAIANGVLMMKSYQHRSKRKKGYNYNHSR